MKISMLLPYAGDFEQSVRQTVELERTGLDIVYIPEVYGFDAVSAMGYLAARTSTVQIASGILPLYTRTPTLLAMTAAGVDHVSGGRCILGIGASGPQVIEGFHGVPYQAPLGRTREIVEICRKVWAREDKLTHHGRHYEIPLSPEHGTGLGKPLKLINHPQRPRIPIHLAALGPKNVAMAAELAEGWLPAFYTPEKANVFADALAAGFEKRDPELGSMDIIAGGIVAVGDDAKAILDLARPTVALYVGGMGAPDKNFYNALIRRYGFEAEAERIQHLYLAGRKKDAEAAVPLALLEATNLVGPESYVKERIAAFADSGVTVLNVLPVDDDPAGLIGKLKAWTA
jgi:F420-dependent oxidoreductase-like protein